MENTNVKIEVGKGTKISLKTKSGEIIKGVVKRIAPDDTLVINGDDGTRYNRNREEVIIIGSAAQSLDEVTNAAPNNFSNKTNKVPIPEEAAKFLQAVDVNQRFDYLAQLTRMVISGTSNSLVVTGEGGLGKTYTILKQVLRKQLVKGEDYVHIKGYSTARGLYRTLFENNGRLIIFDDCDEVLDDKTGQNLLKGALDTYDERIIQWIVKTADESLPDSFEFTGRIIFISNKSKESIFQALLSRCMNIEIAMTRIEMVQRMRFIINNSKEYLSQYSKEIKLECLQLIEENVEIVRELSLRTLEKVIKLKAGEKDMLDIDDEDYAQMDWKELAKFMLLS